MKNYNKYRPGYYMPPEPCLDWMQKERLTQPPNGAASTCGTATRPSSPP